MTTQLFDITSKYKNNVMTVKMLRQLCGAHNEIIILFELPEMVHIDEQFVMQIFQII